MVDVVEAPAPSADDYAQHSFVYLTAIGNALMVGTLVLFLVRIRNEPVKSRGAGMTILSALMCQLHYTLTAVFLFDSYLYRKYGVTNASCHTIYITGLVYVPAATVVRTATLARTANRDADVVHRAAAHLLAQLLGRL